MKIVICGAGQVGSSIARQLASEGNDITLIDQNAELIERVSEYLDVSAIVGFASHPDVLERAGCADADMLIAVTYSDEVNMVACEIAHCLFNVPTKIARIRHQSYLAPAWKDLFRNENMPIDVIISPEYEVAKAVIRRLDAPGAIDMIPFANGQLKVLAVHCMLDCPLLNLPFSIIRQRLGHLKVNVLGLARDGKFIVPQPEHILHAGDDVYFVSDNRDMKRAMAMFGHEEKEAQRVIILGGGNIGLFIAQELEEEDSNTRINIIELSRGRAEDIACRLKHSVVLNGSGLDHEVLREANVDSAETIIAVTNDDEVNVLSSLLAKRHGCQRSITLVNNASYSPLLANLGIDVIVNPRETTVSSILQHVRRGKIRAVHSLMDGQAEIIEAEAIETSALVGKSFNKMELPKGVVLGAILRGTEVIIPTPETVVQVNDHIVILSLAGMIKRVERIFSVSIEFF